MTSSRTEMAAGIEFELKRKRIQNLHIYVKSNDGSVVVTAPISCSDEKIYSFVEERAAWIRRHQSRIRSKSPQDRMALEYEDGDILKFWGEPYVLRVREEAGRTRCRVLISPEPIFITPEIPKIDLYDSGRDMEQAKEVILITPEGAAKSVRERAILRKYKDVLEKEAGPILDKWAKTTGLNCSSWHTRHMKSRWGSCNSNGVICLNTRLAEKSPECLDYIALHETAHLKEMNHGPGFKAILDQYMPSWRETEKLLK